MYDDWLERLLPYIPFDMSIKVNTPVTFKCLGKTPYLNIHSIRFCQQPSLTP